MSEDTAAQSEGSQVIEPQTGAINTTEADPNQNGGRPVMTPETITAAQAPAPVGGVPQEGQPVPQQPDSTLYTLLDNGEYQEQMDVIYPPGTKFYFKRGDGTYYDANIEISPDITQPEITEEFMIAKATEFMELRGYKILKPGEVGMTVESATDFLRANGQIAMPLEKIPTGSVKLEISVLLAKLKSLFNSHAQTHQALDEAHGIISKIEDHL
jgi:hypothetical protein